MLWIHKQEHRRTKNNEENKSASDPPTAPHPSIASALCIISTALHTSEAAVASESPPPAVAVAAASWIRTARQHASSPWLASLESKPYTAPLRHCHERRWRAEPFYQIRLPHQIYLLVTLRRRIRVAATRWTRRSRRGGRSGSSMEQGGRCGEERERWTE